MPNITQVVTLSRSDQDHETGTSVVLAAGNNYVHGQIVVGTTEEVLSVPDDLVEVGLVYIRNKDTTNFINAGFSTGDYPLRIYPNEQGCLPVHPGTSQFYFIANTAECRMEYEITERDADVEVLSTPSASPSGSPSSSPSASPSG